MMSLLETTKIPADGTETVPARVILTRTKNTSWFGAEYNMNLYRGCSHGCIYCDSRSDCYHIGEFNRVRVKEDALGILREELRRKAKPGLVSTGAMSDPYNPLEEKLLLTREALELLGVFGFGVVIATKSDLVARDADVLHKIHNRAPAAVKFTITTADDALAKKLEPYAPAPSKRFAAMDALSKAGIHTGVLLMPVLPFLEDSEENVLAVVRRARECGAKFVFPYFGVTMRAGQREYFLKKLEGHFPGMRWKYLHHYGENYDCRCPEEAKLSRLLREECGRLGMNCEMKKIITCLKADCGGKQLCFL